MNPAALKRTVGDELVALLIAVEFKIRERCLPTRLAVVIENLVFQNSGQPALLRAPSGELVAAFERCQKSFLHQVLRPGRIAQAGKRELKQIITVLIHPPFRVHETCGRRVHR